MSEAFGLIVDGYVHLKDRKALEGLWKYRHRLREQLQEQRSCFFNPSAAIQAIDSDITLIETGLAKLRDVPGD
jgi:hypothetical protein